MLNFLKPKKKFILTDVVKRRIELGKIKIKFRNRTFIKFKGRNVF
jgi:hypothetical protein